MVAGRELRAAPGFGRQGDCGGGQAPQHLSILPAQFIAIAALWDPVVCNVKIVGVFAPRRWALVGAVGLGSRAPPPLSLLPYVGMQLSPHGAGAGAVARLAPRPVGGGHIAPAVRPTSGFDNLGNSCYLNATLQVCLGVRQLGCCACRGPSGGSM
jgi:hypothetical protein